MLTYQILDSFRQRCHSSHKSSYGHPNVNTNTCYAVY